VASPAIVWFRRDLRLADNPALAAAVASGRPVLPLFVLEDDADRAWAPGGAARWWLSRNLAALRDDLGKAGTELVIRRGKAEQVVPALARETGAGEVHWNRRYEPAAIASDTAIKAALREAGLEVHSHNASLLFEPWTIATKAGRPFRVFTPFWRACLASEMPKGPGARPEAIRGSSVGACTLNVGDLGLEPHKPDWAGGLADTWKPGEAGADAALKQFLGKSLQRYDNKRNIPSVEGTSALSPYLQVGALGPRQVWHAAMALGARPDLADGPGVFLKELIWREFSYHLLFHMPHLPEANFDPAFDAMPWRDDAEGLRRWQRGLTGYPMVDAGMRQLWATGWMHNRVRMVVASFLTKHLLIDWRHGAHWFWDTLVDADLASNSASWQWVAGCGADAAPFFRIFNPITQGEKFDPAGDYVRRWVPELAGIPDKLLQKPWTGEAAVMERAGVRLGRNYPEPIVDHAAARKRALETWQTHIRKSSPEE
jgi:deoxyribodipyrimidine photo-lyase